MPRPIAFYAPLKAPDHPVPSGDRLMARLLMRALGGPVALASDLRAYLPDQNDAAALRTVRDTAEAETERLDRDWREGGPPAAWVCYHPYYKAPDLIGPTICERFGVPYVTVETSLSARRGVGIWAVTQAAVLAGVRLATLNVCLTARDRDGIGEAAPQARTARLAPFVDAAPFLRLTPAPGAGCLVTVAMMRPGDKARSFAILAEALSRLTDLPWTLTIIGDGPERAATEDLFRPLAPRVAFTGACHRSKIAGALSTACLYLWPGEGEAYGLAYLEAQAAGVPVVAMAAAGVPEVVAQGRTGTLTPPGDAEAYAGAIRHLLTDDAARASLAAGARANVMAHHDIGAATRRLRELLRPIMEGR